MPEPASKINLKIVVEATGYCPCDLCTEQYTLTKTGTVPVQGRTIAVDNNLIPLGSIVIIDGKKYVAEDIGGGIKGNKIDVYFDNHDDVLEYGRKLIEIEVVK